MKRDTRGPEAQPKLGETGQKQLMSNIHVENPCGASPWSSRDESAAAQTMLYRLDDSTTWEAMSESWDELYEQWNTDVDELNAKVNIVIL